jgi:ribonuclease HII
VATAVGRAAAEEVDRYGLTAALRLAAHRALDGVTPAPACLLLDGSHDYISEPGGRLPLEIGPVTADTPPVETRVRADLRCAAVAAASVLAKVDRDAEMVANAEMFPGYGWAQNKGYATASHREALRRLGPTPLHRRTWRL